jgi:UDP:flavonoid glycosyltransferase YjiC (YdhE family)
MSEPSAVVFVMAENGHFQRVRALVADLVRAGIRTHVFTDRCFRPEVEAAGGRFVDLFAAHALEDADGESIPVPCRNVSFAGAYAEEIAGEVERLAPSLVVYDTFAVVGRVVARLLGLPAVNVCANHNMVPAASLASLAVDPRVALSPACLRAVENLHRLGIEDASPFSYVSGLSPFLNLYCEPAAYLTAAEREVFAPVAFYGSLPSLEEIEARRAVGSPSPFGGVPDERRVYVSFGTIVWRYWAAEALVTLGTIAEALAAMPGVRGLIGLGGTDPGPAAVRALTRPNVSVVGYTDQWRVLRDADAFVTHQGLNSTHEAVFNLVPMVSYPFFGDQPALAEKCRGLGLAVPLVEEPRGPVTAEAVGVALGRLADDAPAMSAALAGAREWELETIAARGSVVERIAGLIGGQAQDEAAQAGHG